MVVKAVRGLNVLKSFLMHFTGEMSLDLWGKPIMCILEAEIH